MTRELIERRKGELIQQRDAMLANVQFANGAIAILEELLNPPPAQPAPPVPEALKNHPNAMFCGNKPKKPAK
jgi:hypothetical protein